MRRTTAITVACMTAAALTVTACGRGSDNGGPAAGQTGAAVSTGKASGTITVWAMGAEGDNLSKLTKDFETANPGVKIQVTAIPWDAAHDKFTAAIAAGNTPDVAMVGTTWMGEFASSNAIDPTPASIDKSAFFDGAQKTTEVNGTSYGIPWYVETRVVYYRTDLAKKAGFDSAPTDWQGLKDMAKAMQTKAGAKWGIGLQAGGEGSSCSRPRSTTSRTSPTASPTRPPPRPRPPSRTSPAARSRCSSPARG
jgi:multiple sugar transport system substrate-binding protein